LAEALWLALFISWLNQLYLELRFDVNADTTIQHWSNTHVGNGKGCGSCLEAAAKTCVLSNVCACAKLSLHGKQWLGANPSRRMLTYAAPSRSKRVISNRKPSRLISKEYECASSWKVGTTPKNSIRSGSLHLNMRCVMRANDTPDQRPRAGGKQSATEVKSRVR
jgi:hypothetical protein